MKKLFKLATFLCVTGLCALGGYFFTQPKETLPPPPEEPQASIVSFAATGDNLVHGALYMQAARRTGGDGYDFSPLYAGVESFLDRYDLKYINQETLVNRVYAPDTYPCFSTPAEVGDRLLSIGFQLFTTSNNHSYDKGAGGVEATLAYWAEKSEQCTVSGFWAEDELLDIPLYEINGITFALLAYTEHTNGIPTPTYAPKRVIYTSETDIIQQQINHASTIADVVIVCPHWGVEDSHTVTQAQRDLAQSMVDWGAGVILGTHPHVLQEAEILQNAETGREVPVIYSLGNFASAQSRPDELIGGFFTMDFVKLEDVTTAHNIQFFPTVTHYGSGHSEVKVYMFEDYTPELANAHGVRGDYPYFNFAYINAVVAENINDVFLHGKGANMLDLAA